MPDPDRYQGFVLDVDPKRDPSRRAMPCVVWARGADEERLFGINLIVTDSYARRHLGTKSATAAQASDLALRWAHGLIDTEDWEATEDAVDVLRDSNWNAARNDSALQDSALTQQLLGVFARMARIAARVDYAPRFDVEGFADVVGVPADRVRGLLNEMDTCRWIEPYGYDKRPTAGHARITKDGFARLEVLRATPVVSDGLARMSWSVESHLRGVEFRERFLSASRSWEHACELLTDEPLRSGIIGYACREAMQAFAGELIAAHGISDAPPSEQVTNRIRAVATRERVGERTAEFLDALVNYWSKTFDLTQRQAKNATREAEQLNAEDARRVVFHTAIVMYELAQLPIDGA